MSTFSFGSKSLAALNGVADPLIVVAHAALEVSEIDFGIRQGVRTDADQLKAWRNGASKLNGIPVGHVKDGVAGTGRGNHQVKLFGPFQGKSTAIDAAPWVNGADVEGNNNAEWEFFFPLAFAFQQAAKAKNVRLRWGAVWDRVLNDLDWSSAADAKAEVETYKVRHPGKDFIDGFHFELA